MRTLLLLGGARHQVPAIETAKRLGYRTILCDYLPDNPGQYVADAFYRVSTTDREAVLSVAQEERVEGVLSFGSDVAAPTAAYVCSELSLPTNPLSSVEVLSEKHLFRAHLAQHGFPCPSVYQFCTKDPLESIVIQLNSLHFPLVIKPTDSSGSKGVSIVSSYETEAIERAVREASRFSRNGILIAEDYIVASFPRVIGGDIFVVDGKVQFWGLMSCLRDKKLGGLVPVGERWPSGLSVEQISSIKQAIQSLVSSLNISFGEMNIEVIIGESNTPFVLELAARAGGNMIPEQLSDLSGIDLVEANVLFAMGERADVQFDGAVSPCGSSQCFATYMLHARKPGLFLGVRLNYELKSFVYRSVLFIEKGMPVEPLRNGSMAIGVLFLRFGSEMEMEQILDAIDELVDVAIG